MFTIIVDKIIKHPQISSEATKGIIGSQVMAQDMTGFGILAFRESECCPSIPVVVSAVDVAQSCVENPYVILDCMRHIREKGAEHYLILLNGEFRHISQPV